MSEHVAIVGAGQAGFQASLSLRQEGFSGQITLIGDEAHFPYMRPPLSKSFVKAETVPPVVFRGAKHFQDSSVDIRLSARVSTIEPSHRHLMLDDGQPVRYDKLILATGARARNWGDLKDAPLNLHYLRNLDHAFGIRKAIAAAQNVCIVGGGFVGLELASTAVLLGKAVTVLEANPALLSRSMIPWMSQWVLDLHRSRGADVRLATRIAQIVTDKAGLATAVLLETGEAIATDLIVVGIGAIPNTELAEKAGLRVSNGIVVDSRLMTAVDGIYAIGDCAAFPDRYGQSMIRLESVQNAVDQAKFLAREICKPSGAIFNALPWFWTEQYENRITIAGIAPAWDRFEFRGDQSENRFNLDVFSGDRLSCVFSVNDAKSHLAARKALAAL